MAFKDVVKKVGYAMGVGLAVAALAYFSPVWMPAAAKAVSAIGSAGAYASSFMQNYSYPLGTVGTCAALGIAGNQFYRTKIDQA